MGIKIEPHVIAAETRSLISKRYKRITKAVNEEFWNSSSEDLHSFYVGSYGRRTAIDTSDLDVLIELPDEEYERFTSHNGNGQSRLLQAVRNAILNPYPNTDVRGDGQVVVICFSDGMRFEILPAFKNNFWGLWDGTYKYPDTHMGGNWKSTNPKAEQEAMFSKDAESNGLLLDTCQHIRFIRDSFFDKEQHLPGIVIDSFVYGAIGGWHYLRDGEERIESNQTFEQALLDKYNADSSYGYLFAPQLYSPGSNMPVDGTKGWTVLGKVLRTMA